jgi:hypothetical protein
MFIVAIALSVAAGLPFMAALAAVPAATRLGLGAMRQVRAGEAMEAAKAGALNGAPAAVRFHRLTVSGVELLVTGDEFAILSVSSFEDTKDWALLTFVVSQQPSRTP